MNRAKLEELLAELRKRHSVYIDDQGALTFDPALEGEDLKRFESLSPQARADLMKIVK